MLEGVELNGVVLRRGEITHASPRLTLQIIHFLGGMYPIV